MAYRRPSHSGGDVSASTNRAIAYPFSNNANSPMPRRGPIEGPYGRLTRRVTWRSTTYKLAAYLWVLGVLYLCWLIRPLFYLLFSSSSLPDRIPLPSRVNDDYFANFYGREECGISSLDLYKAPVIEGTGKPQRNAYCQTREALLEAMSTGVRYDLDTPFVSSGCNYRWYSTDEICTILERFGHIVFAGDESLSHIYAAFNMLLSEDVAHGSLKQWEMTSGQLVPCSCDNQYLNRDCVGYLIGSSEDVYEEGSKGRNRYPYKCSARISHSFISTSSSESEKSHEAFRNLVTSPGFGVSKSIPLVLARASSSSQQEVTETMDKWTSIAGAGVANTPLLWVGPTAASQGSSGFGMSQGLGSSAMNSEARSRGMEVLGMYNATLKASSWDGHSYGERVSLVQAMMIINWLSRL